MRKIKSNKGSGRNVAKRVINYIGRKNTGTKRGEPMVMPTEIVQYVKKRLKALRPATAKATDLAKRAAGTKKRAARLKFTKPKSAKPKKRITAAITGLRRRIVRKKPK